MPLKDKNKRAEYKKNYAEINKERIKIHRKVNREKHKETCRLWQEANKERATTRYSVAKSKTRKTWTGVLPDTC